jgi:YD repeat-containing protein
MKKIMISAFLLASLLGGIHIAAQSNAIGLQKYDYVTNGDTNMYQGIPNIGFPLFNVEIPTTGTSVTLSVNYSTESISGYSLISDVGKGWNLSSIGSVIRNRTRDEHDYVLSSSGESVSDVYSYSFPGGSGKFYIGKNTATQELTAVHTSPSNNRIIITKDNSQNDKIKSFTIIDTKGNRYLFDKININKIHRGADFSFPEVPANTKLINSGFLLSRIFNAKNEEVAAIEYETTIESVNQFVGDLQQNKIKKITIPGTGSIEYLYLSNTNPHSLNNPGDRDWYQLDKVLLKDTRSQIINQYKFVHTNDHLEELINLDKNSAPVQKFAFQYNDPQVTGVANYPDSFGYPNYYDPCSFDEGELRSPGSTNPATVHYGSLKRVNLPTGGSVEYEFESNVIRTPGQNTACTSGQCYYDNHDFDKIQTINFDTSVTNQYTFSKPQGYKNRIFVTYDYVLYPFPPPKPGVPNTIGYTVNNDNGSPFINPYTGAECGDKQYFDLTYGSSSVTVSFIGTRQGHGTMSVYAAKEQPRDENGYGNGLRIKSIKNFNPGSSAPVSYTRYEYSSFTDPQYSSGQILDYAEDVSFIDTGRSTSKPVGYTNIKAVNMIDGSYSRYYFAEPVSLTSGSTPSFYSLDQDMSTYLREAGLLRKREDYSASGQLLQKTETEYQLKDVVLPNITGNGAPVKKINISRQSSVTESYVLGTAKKLVSSSETNTEDKYSNISATKETLPDGSIVEKTFLYPEDKGIQKLLTANMVNIPLETSTKKNGKLVGKAETKFDDASHLYPTSVISYNMQTQTPVTASTLDVYDSKGNLVQTTGKNGIPVTTIWGYYQTQPIAVITGATYAQVSSLATVTAAVNASNADRDNPALEPQLVTALDNLRKDPALQNYTVTATTYDPMVGVTSSVSANGIRTVNVYDDANRLIKTTDAAGKTLQEYKYNYKN